MPHVRASQVRRKEWDRYEDSRAFFTLRQENIGTGPVLYDFLQEVKDKLHEIHGWVIKGDP